MFLTKNNFSKNGLLNLNGFGFQFLRQKLTSSVNIKRFLYLVYWKLPEMFKTQNKIRNLLLDFVHQHNGNIFFLNIGANDGLSGDPLAEFIFKYKWRGVLVEPVPYVFKRLKKIYKNIPNVILENIAISTNNQKNEFWYLENNKNLNSGYDQLGSFDKKKLLDSIKKCNISGGKILKKNIDCLTLEKLLSKNNINKIDIISIDTEGFDYNIIKQIDFKKIKPSLIIFEHVHLDKNDRKNCFLFFKKNGYKTEDIGDGISSVAIRK